MQHILIFIVFILVLGFIITIHELGHFIAAKSFGVYCSEFSIGMGPSLFHFKKGETTYHIRALPIGGYVAMAGEADQEDNEQMKDIPFERTIKGLKTWKQVVVMGAGVFMNFILAAVLMISVFMTTATMPNNTNEVGQVLDDGVCYQILEEGDQLTSLYFEKSNLKFDITTRDDLTFALKSENNQINDSMTSIVLSYERNGVNYSSKVVANYDASRQAYYLGIGPTLRRLTFFESIQSTLLNIKEMSTMIFKTLGQLFINPKDTIGQLSGPVGIYQVTSQVASTGQLSAMAALIASLSINVGIFNLLPIPGLDGSQIIFAFVEKMIGHSISTKLRYGLQMAGMLFVFGLMIIIVIQDIIRLV